MNLIAKIVDVLWVLIGIIASVVLCWLVALLFLYATYSIPSDSMQPTLQPGDRIVVDKTYMGARLFDVNASFKHEPFAIYRLWGRSRLKTGDVAVFNYPYPQTRDSIGFDVMLYYVKRCIGTPGDSLEICNGHYRINGREVTELPETVFGRQTELFEIAEREGKRFRGVSRTAFPKKELTHWTIFRFGPLYIPKPGDIVVLNERHYLIYKRLIEWEQGKKLEWKEGAAWLGGKRIHYYHFKKGYFFMAGDNVFNSIDSRYWGLVPEEFVAGKVAAIWNSIDPYTDEIRWKRIGFIE